MIQLSRLLQLTAGLTALAISGQVLANPCPPGDPPTNCAPPVGTAIFDLAGQAVPHSYTEYTANFTAIGSTTDLAFAFREDPAFWSLDDVSVTAMNSSTNLVSDGDFSNTTLAPWTYDNNYGVITANGRLSSGCGRAAGSGGNCFSDGAVQAYDGIDQNISTVAGQQYTLSFWLSDDSELTTAQQLSTNGDTMDTGGNGIDVLAYAGVGIPVEGGPAAAPEIDPASAMSALTLLLGGLTVLRGRKSTTQA